MPSDSILDIEVDGARKVLNAVGFVRCSSLLIDSTSVQSQAPLLVLKHSALIVVVFIALLRPVCEGLHRMPNVMTLLLPNGFGRAFSVLDIGAQDRATVPPGEIDYGGRRTLLAEISHCILEHLGNNNVFVGSHAAWTLTAQLLVVPACRVVYLGAEKAYQRSALRWRQIFICGRRPSRSGSPIISKVDPYGAVPRPNQTLPKRAARPDCPGRLHRFSVERCGPHFAKQRLHPAVYRLKCTYSLGIGDGLTPKKSQLLNDTESLVWRKRNQPVASLQSIRLKCF